MLDTIDLIDRLQESENCYFIDFLPRTMKSEAYFEIEKFFLDTYLKEFSQKIIRILIKMIGYFPAEIYLTGLPVEPNEATIQFSSLYPFEQDLRDRTIPELAKMITFVITTDTASVQILIGIDRDLLISVDGAFSVSIYNASKKQLQLLSTLIHQENLFLRKE